MPLVLSLKQDQDFFVAGEQFIVDDVKYGVSFTLRRYSTSKMHEITEQSAVEVLPDVWVSSGGFQPGGLVRAVIDAPLSAFILRGDLHRAGAVPGRRSA